ncbi:MAG: DNA mismatch repair endonuclease MutL [Spirochaetales bacterium]|jgi:DNA mismatch repair protein MutL|nr:DNA mismatch repair endonuclease MutL [Spirochaetales bacterium]
MAKIQVLPDPVARRIAAGEVIDRPAAVVRELLDNALDSGAANIRLEIEEGGIRSVTCVDDGEGMEPEDLKLSILSHATSKLADFEDLYKLRTLGFRGEALSSIASCSRLSMISLSRNPGAPAACRVRAEGGRIIDFGEARGNPGTVVSAQDLFYCLPGRREFLKSPSAEGNLCRNVFIEKALPFPQVTLRLFQDGRLKLFLPPASPAQRAAAAYPQFLSPELLREWEADRDVFHFTLAGGGPSLHYRDRRFIQIFVNRRRVSDFSLLQAVEFAYSEILPGGEYPFAFVFITLPPDMVDFNIHPSKKEVRFHDPGRLHRCLVEAIRGELKTSFPLPPGYWELNRSPAPPPPVLYDSGAGEDWGKAVREPGAFFPEGPSSFKGDMPGMPPGMPWEPAAPEEAASFGGGSFPGPGGAGDFRLLGQAMQLFLVVEKNDELYLIDQHAACERILFDRFLSGPRETQELLSPFVFDLEEEPSRMLEESLEDYRQMGFTLEKAGCRGGRVTWELRGTPAICCGMEDEVLSLLTQARGDRRLLEKTLYARAACRKAVKDGEILDHRTAAQLAGEALALKEPRCPHGRPVWFKLSRGELYRLVGRRD